MPRLIPEVVPSGTFRNQPQPRLLLGSGLLLRPWEPHDARVLVAAYEDPAIRHWHHRAMTIGEAADWLKGTAERWAAETDAEWAVAEGDEVLGRVALRDVDLSIGQGEISCWTLPSARWRGIASAAVGCAATWALQEVGFWRLELRHSTQNLASCRVAANAGFTEEATLSLQHIHEDGWHDVHVHSRLRERNERSKLGPRAAPPR